MHPEFDLSPDLCYLNHAAVAPWPRRTVAAVTRFAEANGRRGAADYGGWLATEHRLRERLADLIQAPSPDDIALVKNTSEGLSILAQGLDWQAGDNVVGIAQEFPSNRLPWEALQDQGVDYRILDLDSTDEPEAALDGLCDAHTRLVAVSSVQYARGLRLDLERLSASCRGRGILLCVDAIQSLGALPFDLRRTPVDAAVADGHKWMLGPEGIALLYVAPALRPRLKLRQFGWHMIAHPGDYDRRDWTPSPTATRFECGSPNLLGIHALEASLSLLQEEGMASVASAIEQGISLLMSLMDQAGFEVLTPRAPARHAGILTFRVPGADHPRLWRELQARGVICALRGGGIRFSPHFYTDEAQLHRAIRMVSELSAGQ
ncbi:MAG: aminotransferase class V-fold PLP-dependent enzyme [Chromatiaceae bacterium]